jgi:hypothetical protein
VGDWKSDDEVRSAADRAARRLIDLFDEEQPDGKWLGSPEAYPDGGGAVLLRSFLELISQFGDSPPMDKHAQGIPERNDIAGYDHAQPTGKVGVPRGTNPVSEDRHGGQAHGHCGEDAAAHGVNSSSTYRPWNRWRRLRDALQPAARRDSTVSRWPRGTASVCFLAPARIATSTGRPILTSRSRLGIPKVSYPPHKLLSMDISVHTISNGIGSTKEESWVRVKGRPAGANVGRVVGSTQIGSSPGHCYLIEFVETGEVATYRSGATEPVAAPA